MAEARRTHAWGVFEASIEVAGDIGDPLREVAVRGEFVSPSGRRRRAEGFWDGGRTWRVRFAPDEVGTWRYAVRAQGAASNAQEDAFECVPYEGANPLYRHGPPRMSESRRHLAHADGTPFFFLGDTVWNGPMRAATEADWRHYVETRRAQGFNAALFISTTWKGLPDGGPAGPSFSGVPHRVERINPRFFQRLDARLDALAAAGIVGAPVLLWANGGGPEANPGLFLPEADAILLARYQAARWHAHPVMYILNGDGRYTGEHAARWQRIGRAAFADDEAGVPVALHPSGRQWLGDDFGREPWLDVIGYQSGHGGSEAAWRWLAETGPARGWQDAPGKLVLNLEPCYEDHHRMDAARQQGDFERFTAEDVRRALYWSLLIAPTAGVTYGAHGVWGWDDGSGPPIAHALTGTPKPWPEALRLPAAEQVRHLRDAFTPLPWWTLRPDAELVRDQPDDVLRRAMAARSDDGALCVVYIPPGGTLSLDVSRLRTPLRGTWASPRDGTRHDAGRVAAGSERLPAPPDAGDWLLVLEAARAR